MTNSKKKQNNQSNKSTQAHTNNKKKETTNNAQVKQKKVVKKKEQALDHKCPGCRAPIFFVPSLGQWKCDYCDSSYTLEQLQQYNNASALQHHDVKLNGDAYGEELHEIDSYKCHNCGAEIIADNQTSATFCVYCGNTAILKSKLTGEFKPDLIIPFKTEKQKAIDSFKQLAKGRPFLPSDFSKEGNIEKIRGIYIPFWIYDMTIQGGLEARGQISTRWSRGDRVYTKTDYYKIIREGSVEFDKIPIDGSSRFANDIMSSIEPFDYNELQPYNHAYLSGFLAERYDIDGDTLVGDAVTRAVESTKETFLSDSTGYSSKTLYNNTLRAQDVKRQYALFPVWMVNVKYKDKYYLFAMNGQTGEFIGDMPVDKAKVIKWILICFTISFAVIILITWILYTLGVTA